MTQTHEKILITADLTINEATQLVYKNKQLLSLSDLSYKTFLTLVKATPKVVGTDELIDQVWQDVEVSSETVTQRIALLRKALITGDDEAHDKYIKSIRNKGYRWVPSVTIKTKGPANLRISIILASAVLLLVALYYWANQHQPTNPIGSVNIRSEPSVDDYTQQAWHYLEKHEAKSNVVAIGLFRKSLAVNPNQINSLTGLSIALSHQVTKFNQSGDLLIEAKEAAEQAITINPNHAQAWAALAFVYDAKGELEEAVNRYEKSLALNPDDYSTASSLAYLYAEQGRLVEALQLNLEALGSRQLYLDLQIAQVLDLLGFDAMAEKWYTKADELSPDNVFATQLRARYYLSRSQYQKAEAVVEAAIERGVKRPGLPLIKGILAWLKDDVTLAMSLFEQAVLIDPSDVNAQLWLFLSQHPEGASVAMQQSFIDTWFLSSDGWPASGVTRALFYTHFGDTEVAFTNLEQAFADGYRNYLWLRQLPVLKSLHSHPRWLKLLEAIQNDVSAQRQTVLQADWIPTSFLDPKS